MPRNITVTFADGSTHVYQNAPDNVTPEQVSERAAKDFGKQVRALDGGKQPRKTIADRTAPEGRFNTLTRSFTNSGLAGFADNIVAATNAVVPVDRLFGRKEDTVYGGEGFKKAYQANLGRERAQADADSKSHPRVALAGDIAGVVASPLNKVGAGIKGANMLARFGRFAAPAAAYGAAEGVHGTGNAFQRLKRAGIGAAESVAGSVAGLGVGKAARKIIAPKFSAAVQSLLDKGVRLTPGQMSGGSVKSAEDKMMSVTGLGALIKNARHQSIEDWNKAIYNRVLEPLGIKYQGKEVGHEGVDRVESLLSKGYDQLLPKLQFKGDGKFVKDLNSISTKAKTLTGDEMRQLQAAWDVHVLPRLQRGGIMDGKTFKQVESELSKLARGKGPTQPDLASKLSDIVGAMRSQLERSNPIYAPSLKRLNQSWAGYARLRDAASRRLTSGGLITPTDLLAAVKKGDRSVGKGAFARGEAMMQREAKQAHDVLPSTVPNSGTADRLAAGGAAGAALFGHGAVTAAAAAHPVGTAAALAAAGAYTKPGMNALRALATKGSPKTRNALAKAISKAATRSGQYLGPAAAQKLLGGGS